MPMPNMFSVIVKDTSTGQLRPRSVSYIYGLFSKSMLFLLH